MAAPIIRRTAVTRSPGTDETSRSRRRPVGSP
jgi:hypothetical protein